MLERNADTLPVPPSALVAGTQLSLATSESPTQDSNVECGVTFAFGLLVFMSCQLFGSTIANTVVEEKETRVVEVILAATSAQTLLTGKVVGNAVLGIAQMAVFAGVALLAGQLLGGIPDFGAIARSSG